jgi:hypothetical protein
MTSENDREPRFTYPVIDWRPAVGEAKTKRFNACDKYFVDNRTTDQKVNDAFEDAIKKSQQKLLDSGRKELERAFRECAKRKGALYKSEHGGKK